MGQKVLAQKVGNRPDHHGSLYKVAKKLRGCDPGML